MKILFCDIDSNEKFEIWGESTNGDDLIRLMESTPSVDLVITDTRMPIIGGLSAMVYLRHKFRSLKIILLAAESLYSLRKMGAVDKEYTDKFKL